MIAATDSISLKGEQHLAATLFFLVFVLFQRARDLFVNRETADWRIWCWWRSYLKATTGSCTGGFSSCSSREERKGKRHPSLPSHVRDPDFLSRLKATGKRCYIIPVSRSLMFSFTSLKANSFSRKHLFTFSSVPPLSQDPKSHSL